MKETVTQKEYALIFNKDKCVLCHACETACKIHNNLETGVSWRKVKSVWQGSYPAVNSTNISFSCMHCAEPECMEACPVDAITKNLDGIVLVDDELCIGCRSCFDACPVKIPQFGENDKMQKCNLCVDRLKKGETPVCADTCPGGAIEVKIIHTSDKIKLEKEMTDYFR
jgi:Fe-S-cluster-containing dehydrogenase component